MAVPTAVPPDSIAAVCARCWELTSNARRALLDVAMTRVLARDPKRTI